MRTACPVKTFKNEFVLTREISIKLSLTLYQTMIPGTATKDTRITAATSVPITVTPVEEVDFSSSASNSTFSIQCFIYIMLFVNSKGVLIMILLLHKIKVFNGLVKNL